jgi:hypothetical protein
MITMSTLAQVLDSFFEVAAAACTDILANPPDLVIALMHAGRFSLLATQTLWHATQTAPFPPVLLVNIGTEKMRRYEEMCNDLEFRDYTDWNMDPWGKGHSFEYMHRETGHLLAWVMRQEAWLSQLRSMVEDVLGASAAPQRILVLEDFIQDGRSCLIAQGLLRRLFPNAEMLMLAGTVSLWRDTVVEAWLAEQGQPALGATLKGIPYTSSRSNRLNAFHHLNRILTGAEDTDRESLDWSPLTANSEHVQALSPYLSAEHCLTLPTWTEQTIVAYIKQRLPGWQLGREHQVLQAQLLPEQLLSAHLWLYGHTSSTAAAAWAGLSPEQAEHLLESFVQEGWAVWRGSEGGRCCDLLRRGVLLYGPIAQDPGPDLLAVAETISDVMTPFPVEFARTNGVHGPYLVPAPEGMGACVPARLLHMIPDLSEEEICNRLICRESRLLGQPRDYFSEYKEAATDDPIHICQTASMGGLDRIFYVQAQPNQPEILDASRSHEEQATILAQIALQSQAAAQDGDIDGVSYLIQALAQDISTPLTPHYQRTLDVTRSNMEER